MLELFETRPGSEVQDSEYKRLLGYPRRHDLEGRAREIAETTRAWFAEHGRPWIYAHQTSALELSRHQLKINGTAFSSSPLLEQFHTAEVESAVLVAVSAGAECEERARALWQEGKPDEYFFMEMFGSAVVEHLVASTNGRLCGWADACGMVALPHYSPGYSGWDVADQIKLWELIRATANGKLSGPLEVMESGMLRPKKSLLAIVGLTHHLEKARAYATLVPCDNCSLAGCQYRRVPYAHFPPQIEAVVRLQPETVENGSPQNGELPSLNHFAKYTINGRALRKWSQERLQIKTLDDGSFEARFRYEGTTCSNMGRTLEYDYFIHLASGHDRYRILETSCAPIPGDTGHTFQCEYLKDAAAFMRTVAEEKPLLGRPLNDVLAWERPYNPSACYCDSDRRAHKWGLVFEVIHHALVEREKAATNARQAAQILE